MAITGTDIVFAPFRLDLQGERLLEDDRAVALRPKSFAVLRYLVEHAFRLVTKEELLSEIWGEVAVGDAVLKTSLKEIRHALGDSARTPRFVETAHGRGYRFIRAVGAASAAQLASSDERPALNRPRQATHELARHAELATLEEALAAAREGKRQVVFVSGETGIGKTHLVGRFLERAAKSGAWVGRGQCLEQQATGEPYLPVLEALGRLCHGEHGRLLLETLECAAPSWVDQFPWVKRARGDAAREHASSKAMSPRMLRELTDALELLTQRYPIVLSVDDIEYADAATLDLIHYLGQRSDPAALMLVCTYCPLDGSSAVRQHLRVIERGLKKQDTGSALSPPLLPEAAILEYLARRFPEQSLPPTLASVLLRRSSGKPLYVVKLLESWLQRELITLRAGRWSANVGLDLLEQDVPDAIVQSVEGELERLRPEQRLILETASVIGVEFSAGAVALALGHDVTLVEEECLMLARAQRFVRTTGMLERWGGTSTQCCEFIHPLQHQILQEHLGHARRAQLLSQLNRARNSALSCRSGVSETWRPSVLDASDSPGVRDDSLRSLKWSRGVGEHSAGDA
jgi:DNA-binding winged helix-turn-helix (wHTH) protein